MAGARDLTSVVQAVCRLDADVDVTGTFRKTTNTSKTFLEDGDPDGNDGMLSGEAPDADELDNFYLNEQNES